MPAKPSISLLLLYPTACFLAACSTQHSWPKAEAPVHGILTGEMNHQHDPVKTERFMERVGEQASYIAEPAYADGLAHINRLPAKEQNTASAYIRAWQALRYFNLELDAGLNLRPFTAFTILETLEKNTWTDVRNQSAGILARITGYTPDEPPPNRYSEADQAGGPRPGSLKNLNEPVRTHPFGLIDPVRQTGQENDYYTRLANTYRLILEDKSKGLSPPLPEAK
jgi:hypothetical protein